ncbi:hypothetical protein DUQ00_15410 [Salmonella bongori]|uniref:DDRRRQL repeat protein YjdP n=1 Tax=Salmonella bongori TaxID=54736 RepID=UPI001283D5D6|nr:DDRRRQL repeat protein YjdP [Salmonella bongori]EGE4656357.1 hypothetical protein [Salmonella bongori serovar 40:z35:- str. 95-0123]ECC8923792.1 hypothetical protein [Salmonella bongori]ECC9597667.1 hypothetical protein [Salmonella bongori]EDP8664138.1 hypothetical protein [Salmonella bongori]QVP37096.1 hypothetical protein AIT23_19130 [Salmonella bongori serovar 40:z35:-]
MKRISLLFFLALLALTTLPARADIIDEAMGHIQQALSEAYKTDNGRDYDDDRDDGWQRTMSDDRRRQFEDRRRQLDDRQRQLDQERRQLEAEERRMEDDDYR